MEERQNLPKWFEKLQENSWELELLISGGAIFSLFQLSDYYVEVVHWLKMNVRVFGMGFFMVLGMFSIKFLTVGFGTHLILRSYWLGLFCIHHLYPSGASRSEGFRLPFRNELDRGVGLEDMLIRVDRYASMAMFLSILVVVMVFGWLVAIFVFMMLPFKLFSGVWVEIYLDAIPNLFYVYWFDLLLFGVLRKSVLSRLLYPFFYCFDLVSLRFVYSRALGVYRSHVRKRQAVLVFVPFVLLSSLMTYYGVYKLMHWQNIFEGRQHIKDFVEMKEAIIYWNYMDKVRDSGVFLWYPAIESEVISSSYLKVYVPYHGRYDYILEETHHRYLSDLIEVSLDSCVLDDLVWHRYVSSRSDELGMVAMVDISHLKRGRHVVRISDGDRLFMTRFIPFWKEEQ